MGVILANEPLLQAVWGVSGGGAGLTLAGAWSPDRVQGIEEAGLVLGDGPDPGEERAPPGDLQLMKVQATTCPAGARAPLPSSLLVPAQAAASPGVIAHVCTALGAHSNENSVSPKAQ